MITISIGFRANAQKLFSCDKFSFSVVGPTGWQVLNHEDKKDAFNHSHSRQNLITYYKNSNNIVGALNPTISIFVVPNPFKDIDEFNKKMKRRRYEKYLTNYSLKEKPQLLTIGGKYGVFETSTYLTNNEKEEPLNVKKRVYVFPSKKYLFYVNLVDERNNEENVLLFNSLVQSIKIPK